MVMWRHSFYESIDENFNAVFINLKKQCQDANLPKISIRHGSEGAKKKPAPPTPKECPGLAKCRSKLTAISFRIHQH